MIFFNVLPINNMCLLPCQLSTLTNTTCLFQPKKLTNNSKCFFNVSGKWFDGSQPTVYVDQTRDPDFAPEFMMANQDKYSHLLKNKTTITAAVAIIQTEKESM